MTIMSYQDLVVWQKAMDLVELVYRNSERFPKTEVIGLTSQMRRAAVSLPSNIAEGQGRKSTKEFLKHLSIGYGSLLELETQTQIAERLNYLNQSDCKLVLEATGELGRLLNGLMNSLSTKLTTDH
jgi:four helix bundle protein